MSKTVLVTGAASGIGRATAMHFLARGWSVVATMRDPARAPVAGYDPGHDRLLVTALDVAADGSADAAVAAAIARFGRLDVVVNNAGFGPIGPLETMPIDEIARIFQTNSLGTIRVVQAALPVMRGAGGGRIVNVSSMGGEFTTPFAGAYHASKYALESLSDALRFEVAPFGVDVVVVQPGPVATDLADRAIDSLAARATGPYAARLAAFAETSRRQIAAGRGVLLPDQVASAILRVAEARRPPTRVKVGSLARVLPLLRRRLPDRLWDALWARMIPAGPVPMPSAKDSA